MAICSVATRMSAIGTTVRGPSVYSTAALKPHIIEIGVSNTTAVACAVGVVRATATGTPGAALTEVCISDDSSVIVATAANTHTADATVGAAIVQASLGAAVGSGWIWNWEIGEFVLDNATGSGVVINCPTGTGQILDFWIKWRE